MIGTPTRCALTTVVVAALAAAVVVSASSVAAKGRAAREYEVKAAFLFHLTKFVEWPPEAFADEDAPFVIAVLGPDPFGPRLDWAVAGKRVGSRALVIKRLTKLNELDACHVLFVSSGTATSLVGSVPSLGSQAMLTVGETDRFAELGGMVEFVVRENKVRFRINRNALEQAGLKARSQLLSLAEIVDDRQNRGARRLLDGR